jgi:excisionase family DNA binding protein
MPKEPNSTPIRVSVSEAAKLFGVSTKTIRDAIKGGQIKYIVVKERYKINFESLIEWSQSTPNRLIKRDRDGIGKYVNQWRIKNKLYSPSWKLIEGEDE